MKIIANDQLDPKHGKYALPHHLTEGHALISMPFQVEGIPNEAKFLAWEFIDYNVIPRFGAPALHWSMTNVPVVTDIPENFSQTSSVGVQGGNAYITRDSFKDLPISKRFVGASPYDEHHIYTLYVYALSAALDLQEGYFANHFHDQLKSVLLAKAKKEMLY